LDRLGTFEFAHPWWFLLALLPLAMAFLRGRGGPVITVRYSSVALLRQVARKPKSLFGGFTLSPLWFVGILLLSAGMARPHIEQGRQTDETEGIDIMLVLDFSYSMQEGTLEVEGEKITFIDALKKITRNFVKNRPNDRLGIIGFAVEPYLVSPLTSEHEWVMETLDDMDLDLGTAIGSAMYAGVKSLQQSDRKTRILVVVTDGNNNIGMPPQLAAQYARQEKIRIYPVEITAGRPLTPRRIAAHPLYNVAKTANGSFFQAKDFKDLTTLYQSIEALDKSFIQEEKIKAFEELFQWFVIPGLLILFLDFLLVGVLRRKLP